MTDDFLTYGSQAVNALQTLFVRLEQIKNFRIMFERGGTATLSLSLGQSTLQTTDFKANIKGEMVKGFVKAFEADTLAKIKEGITDLQTLLESEENAE